MCPSCPSRPGWNELLTLAHLTKHRVRVGFKEEEELQVTSSIRVALKTFERQKSIFDASVAFGREKPPDNCC
jgi:hypothetical protein